MARIRLSPSASVTPTGQTVLLRSDLGTFQLEGHDIMLFLREILPLLDGTRDRETVVDALGGYSRQSVFAFLDLLQQYGLLETISESSPSLQQERWRGQEEFFRKWTDTPEEAIGLLREARILLVGLEPWGVVAATELAAAGVGQLHLLDEGEVVEDDLLSVRTWSRQHLGRPRRQALMEVIAEAAPWCHVTTGALELSDGGYLALNDTKWNLAIGATTADNLLVFQGLARFAHQADVISLSSYLEGLEAFVGPVVIPGQTACWNCCRLRLLANSEDLQSAHALQTSLLTQRPYPRTRTYLAPMTSVPGYLVALEAIKLITQYTSSGLVEHLLVQNLVTLESTFHKIIRMPWCDICGGASNSGFPSSRATIRGKAEHVDLGGQVSSQQLEGARDPEHLRTMLAGWVDHRTGVVKYLMPVEPDATEPELPITSAAVLASYTEGSYQPHNYGLEMSSGKGLSSIEAMISAVGEAIERYSATRYRRSDLHRSSLNELEGDVLDPRHLCLYNEIQYIEPGFPFARFDPDQPIEWTRGQWLNSGEPVWLPALPTYLNLQVRSEELFCQVTSNGLAAGADLKDASLRAVFELIERDAFMITWLCQRQGRKLLLDNTIEAGAREVVRQLEERGVEIELYLLDIGLSIPTVVSLGLGNGKDWPGVTVALAAHMSPRTATRKAILEQGQVGPHIRRLMLDGKHRIPANSEEVSTLEDHAFYYVPAERIQLLNFFRFGGGEPIPLAEIEEPRDISLEGCIERLRVAGVRVAIKNVTSPDVVKSPFRVVRALGMDIQPIDFGFKLRRLANPRLQAQLQLSNLNLYPHPLA